MISPNHNGLPKVMNNANDFAFDMNNENIDFDGFWTFAVEAIEETYLSTPLLNENDYKQISKALLWE